MVEMVEKKSGGWFFVDGRNGRQVCAGGFLTISTITGQVLCTDPQLRRPPLAGETVRPGKASLAKFTES